MSNMMNYDARFVARLISRKGHLESGGGVL